MIVREYDFPVSFHGTIFDAETTSLEPSQGELITLGYFTGGYLKIYQREDVDGSERDLLLEEVQKLTTLPRPYLSYNREFEEKWLGIKLDFDIFEKWKKLCEDIKETGKMWCKIHGWVKPDGHDLCPECGGWLWETIKWPKASQLISLPHGYYFESDIRGEDVPKIWERYQNTEDKLLLELIMFHNFNDLVRNYCLYVWDETVAKLVGERLKKSAKKPRSIYELLMGRGKRT